MPATTNRRKLSTTIAPQTETFLKSLVQGGRASNLAEAVDQAVEIARRAEARRRLENATRAFYQALSGQKSKKEKALEAAIGRTNSLVDYDAE